MLGDQLKNLSSRTLTYQARVKKQLRFSNESVDMDVESLYDLISHELSFYDGTQGISQYITRYYCRFDRFGLIPSEESLFNVKFSKFLRTDPFLFQLLSNSSIGNIDSKLDRTCNLSDYILDFLTRVFHIEKYNVVDTFFLLLPFPVYINQLSFISLNVNFVNSKYVGDYLYLASLLKKNVLFFDIFLEYFTDILYFYVRSFVYNVLNKFLEMSDFENVLDRIYLLLECLLKLDYDLFEKVFKVLKRKNELTDEFDCFEDEIRNKNDKNILVSNSNISYRNNVLNQIKESNVCNNKNTAFKLNENNNDITYDLKKNYENSNIYNENNNDLLYSASKNHDSIMNESSNFENKNVVNNENINQYNNNRSESNGKNLDNTKAFDNAINIEADTNFKIGNITIFRNIDKNRKMLENIFTNNLNLNLYSFDDIKELILSVTDKRPVLDLINRLENKKLTLNIVESGILNVNELKFLKFNTLPLKYKINDILSNAILSHQFIRENIDEIVIKAVKSEDILTIDSIKTIMDYINIDFLFKFMPENDIEMKNIILIADLMDVNIYEHVFTNKLFYESSIEYILNKQISIYENNNIKETNNDKMKKIIKGTKNKKVTDNDKLINNINIKMNERYANTINDIKDSNNYKTINNTTKIVGYTNISNNIKESSNHESINNTKDNEKCASDVIDQNKNIMILFEAIKKIERVHAKNLLWYLFLKIIGYILKIKNVKNRKIPKHINEIITHCLDNKILPVEIYNLLLNIVDYDITNLITSFVNINGYDKKYSQIYKYLVTKNNKIIENIMMGKKYDILSVILTECDIKHLFKFTDQKSLLLFSQHFNAIEEIINDIDQNQNQNQSNINAFVLFCLHMILKNYNPVYVLDKLLNNQKYYMSLFNYVKNNDQNIQSLALSLIYEGIDKQKSSIDQIKKRILLNINDLLDMFFNIFLYIEKYINAKDMEHFTEQINLYYSGNKHKECIDAGIKRLKADSRIIKNINTNRRESMTYIIEVIVIKLDIDVINCINNIIEQANVSTISKIISKYKNIIVPHLKNIIFKYNKDENIRKELLNIENIEVLRNCKEILEEIKNIDDKRNDNMKNKYNSKDNDKKCNNTKIDDKRNDNVKNKYNSKDNDKKCNNTKIGNKRNDNVKIKYNNRDENKKRCNSDKTNTDYNIESKKNLPSKKNIEEFIINHLIKTTEKMDLSLKYFLNNLKTFKKHLKIVSAFLIFCSKRKINKNEIIKITKQYKKTKHIYKIFTYLMSQDNNTEYFEYHLENALKEITQNNFISMKTILLYYRNKYNEKKNNKNNKENDLIKVTNLLFLKTMECNKKTSLFRDTLISILNYMENENEMNRYNKIILQKIKDSKDNCKLIQSNIDLLKKFHKKIDKYTESCFENSVPFLSIFLDSKNNTIKNGINELMVCISEFSGINPYQYMA